MLCRKLRYFSFSLKEDVVRVGTLGTSSKVLIIFAGDLPVLVGSIWTGVSAGYGL